MLTTKGAKSGEPRTVAVYGIPHPDGLALIASNFGGAKHPAWYHNLKANPEATVTVGRDTWHATARLATPRERDESGPKASSCTPAGESTKRGPAIDISRRSFWRAAKRAATVRCRFFVEVLGQLAAFMQQRIVHAF